MQIKLRYDITVFDEDCSTLIPIMKDTYKLVKYKFSKKLLLNMLTEPSIVNLKSIESQRAVYRTLKKFIKIQKYKKTDIFKIWAKISLGKGINFYFLKLDDKDVADAVKHNRIEYYEEDADALEEDEADLYEEDVEEDEFDDDFDEEEDEFDDDEMQMM